MYYVHCIICSLFYVNNIILSYIVKVLNYIVKYFCILRHYIIYLILSIFLCSIFISCNVKNVIKFSLVV